MGEKIIEVLMFIQIKSLSLQKFYTAFAKTIALVAKLVDAPDLGSGVVIRVGSSPIRRTMGQKRNFRENFPLLLFYKSLKLWILQ